MFSGKGLEHESSRGPSVYFVQEGLRVLVPVRFFVQTGDDRGIESSI